MFHLAFLLPLPLLSCPRFCLIHQTIHLATSSQRTQQLHTERQVVVMPPRILQCPLCTLLFLGMKLRLNLNHCRIILLNTNCCKGIQTFIEVGTTILDDSHEIEFDFSRTVVGETCLDSVPCHLNPLIFVSLIFFALPHLNWALLEAIQLINAAILMWHICNEMKDVIIIGSDTFRFGWVTQECVLRATKRVVSSSNFITGANGLPSQIWWKMTRKLLEIGECPTQHEATTIVILLIFGFSTLLGNNGITCIKQHRQDSLSCTSVLYRLLGKKQPLWHSISRQRRSPTFQACSGG
mmetsp:Transcript_7146/g.11674  ORF Transcript_7146/g.11674 Transcript_7146/m.11674 type:complete len:295 (-) Transcript_7146:260-1144(-)